MKRENLIKHWKEVVAFKEGKQIQFEYTNGGWLDIDDPFFDINVNYRIKPSKLEQAADAIGKYIGLDVYGDTVKKEVRELLFNIYGDE